ncbi:Helix-turn-helix regulator [Dyella terrae]|nr:Helix-turn-helix regulator [Dyella terrae]
MGVSPDALQRYIRDDNNPTFDAVAKLCHAGNVSLVWLATGQGEMAENPWNQPSFAVSQTTRLNSEILREAVKLLRAIYDLVGARYDMEADPDLLVETYAFLADHDGQWTSADVIDFSKRLADRRRAKERQDAEGQGTSSSTTGGAGAGSGKAGRIPGQGSW